MTSIKLSRYFWCTLNFGQILNLLKFQKAGLKKLKSMKNLAEFRRKIITKEWEHKVLKLKVRDLREHVKTIEKCKITKEVQMWLKWREKGWNEDLGEAALNREVENSVNMQEKLLNET